MGYVNRDHRIYHITAPEKLYVKRLRRLVEKRALREEHQRAAVRATRRGWWYA